MRDSQRKRVYTAEREAFDGMRAFIDHGVRGEYVGRTRRDEFPHFGPGGHTGIHTPAGDVVWYRQKTVREWHPDALRTVAKCQALVDKVVGSRWWKSRSTVREVAVLTGQGARTARAAHYARGPVIKLPLWARTKPVILHELAHHLAGLDEKHGPVFAADYLALVQRWMGPKHIRRLSAAYKRNRVKHRRTSKEES